MRLGTVYKPETNQYHSIVLRLHRWCENISAHPCTLLGIRISEALLKGCSSVWGSVETIPQKGTDVGTEQLLFVLHLLPSPSQCVLVSHEWEESL